MLTYNSAAHVALVETVVDDDDDVDVLETSFHFGTENYQGGGNICGFQAALSKC